MPNDYIKKEPTKSEKFMYELAMHQQQLEHQTYSNAMQFLAVAVLTKQDPAQVAQLLTDGEEKLKEFGKKINEEIDKIRKAKESQEKIA